MKTFTFTPAQLAVLIHAVDVSFDIEDDTVMEELWVGQSVTAITREELSIMREATEEKVTNLLALQSVKLMLES